MSFVELVSATLTVIDASNPHDLGKQLGLPGACYRGEQDSPSGPDYEWGEAAESSPPSRPPVHHQERGEGMVWPRLYVPPLCAALRDNNP